jgi:tetratricopeptide (TPR) repeat protein
MKRTVQLLTLIAAGCFGASVQAQAGASMTVGDFGSQSALMIDGNQTFTTEQILRGLTSHLDYHIAAHPAAPLAEYTTELGRQISRGYQRAGFPSVQVNATAETNTHRLVVHVTEGPRYRCGEILLSGVPAMTNEVVRRKIADVIGGLANGSNPQTDQDSTVWLPGQPAPLDGVFYKTLTNQVQEALTALNYYQPKVSVQIVPDTARKLADLKIEFADEGFKGTVAEFQISGLQTNSRAQLLDYLKLKPGMALEAKLVTSISNQLWLSARFFRHDVVMLPLPSSGQFKLRLDLEEVREAPPLNRDFSPEEKAVLKFRDWLAGWETQPEDLVVTVSPTGSSLRGRADLILSPSGTALAIRNVLKNGPASLLYGFVASRELIGLYSVERQSKFTMPRINERGYVLLSGRPSSPKSYGQGAVNFQIMMGLPQSQPFRLEMELRPAVFLSMAHWMESSLKDGVLTLRQALEGAWQEIRIEAATGRLLNAAGGSSATNSLNVRLHLETGALARLNKEIGAVTADFPNFYVTDRVFGSWASFMVADIIEPPLIERALAWLDGGTVQTAQSNSANASSHRKMALALAREILGQRKLDTVFNPLNRLFRSDSENNKTDFLIPLETSASPLAPVCVLVLNLADVLALRDSWPWISLRESAFTVAGQGKYSQAELSKLLSSETVGPVGFLATAYMLGRTAPKLARTFAERGLARLNLAAFQQDYRLLLRTNSVVGDLAANALGLLSDVNEQKFETLLASLAPDEAAFLRQVRRLLAQSKGQPPGDAIWPAFAQHWDTIPRHYLESGLNQFLPQVQFLTNGQALYERGLLLTSPDSARHDSDEAALCFRKAANMGHAGAQVSYGHLCEAGKGVPQNFAEALAWYRRAAEQNAPHAMCSIAVMYNFGKGVPQDLDKAARFYRDELAIVEDCVYSQFNLGQICEAKNDLEEALKWYRRAAEEGWPPAEARLGDLLSDSFFSKPDFVEACQWLSLAAAAGDKMSEARLHRMKTKLTSQQLDEVEKRVAGLTRRLEEQKKRAKPQ